MREQAPYGDVYLKSAARTATVSGAVIKGARNVAFRIKSTAITSTPSVVPTVEAYDEAAGAWVAILTAAAITTNSADILLEVGPDTDTATNLRRRMALPAQVRLTMTHSDTDSITYSIGAWVTPL
jgi:hypothetical protein